LLATVVAIATVAFIAACLALQRRQQRRYS
jgi:hypothetical protein